MSKLVQRTLGVALAAGLAVTALTSCGSSGDETTADGKKIIKVGVLWPNTGDFSATYKAELEYVQARINQANETDEIPGVEIQLEARDDTSAPAGALTAAKDLVQSEKVFGIIDPSPNISGIYRYLAQANVPTVSSGQSGQECSDPISTSIFCITATPDPGNPAATTWGKYMASQGVTSLAAVAYADAPPSVSAVKIHAASAEAAGLATPYINTSSVKVGSTDFAAVALAIKESGADGLAVALDFGAEAALANALKQAGVNMKASFSYGYGSDMLANQSVVDAKQGWSIGVFPQLGQPFEAQTEPTKKLAADMKQWANLDGDPGNAATFGWMSANLFVEGLKAAGGKDATPESFITNLRAEKNYNPYGGIFGATGIDFSQVGQQQILLGPDNCLSIVKLQGTEFVPVPDASPICGELIPDSDTN